MALIEDPDLYGATFYPDLYGATFYHITPKSNVPSIMSRGLIPSSGSTSRSIGTGFSEFKNRTYLAIFPEDLAGYPTRSTMTLLKIRRLPKGALLGNIS